MFQQDGVLTISTLPRRANTAARLVMSERCHRQKATLLNHLIGAAEQHRWHFEAERFRSLEIDTQLEFGRLVNGISPGLVPLRILSMTLATRRKMSARSGE